MNDAPGKPGKPKFVCPVNSGNIYEAEDGVLIASVYNFELAQVLCQAMNTVPLADELARILAP